VKKILISVLIILLLILSYFALVKGIGFLKIRSINDIKNASIKLENDFNEANELSSKTYPTEVETLESAIKQLKISKQEYNSKNLYSINENSLGVMEIKTYKIHYLWTIIGNYRKDRGVQSLNLDLKETELDNVYDLEFTLVGPYTNTIDFLYDIENDEELNFEIGNLKMKPYSIKTTTTVTDGENSENKKTEVVYPFDSITDITTSSALKGNTAYGQNTTNGASTTNGANSTSGANTTKSETIYDPKWIETTFTVNDIGITLD